MAGLRPPRAIIGTVQKPIDHKSLMALDMVLLMLTDLRLCHPFFRRETKKLSDIMMLVLSSSSVMVAFPTAEAKQVTFFSWNLTEERTSSTLLTRVSL